MDRPLSSNQIIFQRGAALVVSMVMLVAITIIGVFTMSNSHLEWLMTNNSRFQSDAFMLAEATLDVAETNIPNDPSTVSWGDPFYNDAVLPNPDALPSDPNQLSSWNSYTSSAAINAPAGTTNNYVIDYLGCTIESGSGPCGTAGTASIYTYRVWARSISGNGASRIIRSTFAVRLSAGGVISAPRRLDFTEIPS